MRGFSADWRRTFNVILPVVILGDMVLYRFCLSSCSSLRGVLIGVDMKYVGLIIPLPLIALALLKQDLLYSLGLSFGLGGEFKLIAFQARHGVYCPYCLFAGAIILFLFLINFDRSRKILMGSFIVIGLLFFHLFFHGAVSPSYGEKAKAVPFAVALETKADGGPRHTPSSYMWQDRRRA
jgi:hypothetical protein